MGRLDRFAWVAVLAGSAACLAAAGERGGRRAAKEPAPSECELMLAELQLNAEQQAQLKEKCKAKEDALAAWNAANADKLRAAEDAAKAAKTAADPAARKRANDDLKALHAERDRAAADAAAAVLAVLTPEQRAAWDAFKLYQTVIQRYRKAEPTGEQLAKIKAACRIACKELEAYQGDDKAAKKGRAETSGKLYWAIEAVILTPEQRELTAKDAGRKKAEPAAPAPGAAPAP